MFHVKHRKINSCIDLHKVERALLKTSVTDQNDFADSYE